MKTKILLATMATTLLATQSIGTHSNKVHAAEETNHKNQFSGIKEVKGNEIHLNSGIIVTKENENKTTATDEKGNLEYVAIKKSDDLIELKNVQTGEIKEIKINSETYVESQQEQNDTDSIINKSNPVKYAAGPPKGSVDGYTYVRTTKHNTLIDAAEEGAVVTIITSICGPLGTAAGVAYSIASVYKASKSKMMYWKERTYTKRLDKWSMSLKTQYNYYKDSEYKNYIKTITKYKTYQGGGI